MTPIRIEMDERSFWVTIWMVIGTVFLIFVFMLLSYNNNKNEELMQLINDHPNKHPVAISCAYDIISDATCDSYLIHNIIEQQNQLIKELSGKE